MTQQLSTISIICNRCDVSVQVDQRNDPEDRAHCPMCGADFGTWHDIVQRLPDKRYEAYRDMNSWRLAQ